MTNAVQVTEVTLALPTYPEPEAEALPMFAKSRVHQRSSGNPYPNRVVLSVDRSTAKPKEYRCIRLENEYLRVEILPELGGRIYSAYDKITGYDFFYKQHVIKPALIGLLGSWVSGGCEFNWPCHHRPSTYMPVDDAIEREEGGAVTVWLSEHEPLGRMKGMVGVRLAPGVAVLETRMRVYNRTPLRQSFLWWENAAVPVNESYRLFFPQDVHYVQFHYRKNVTTFPVATGTYNGISMGEGVDIRLHRNTRHPTSYFCAETRHDFFGGYDEGRGCGVVHVASRHTSIGKKMFTWAYGQLARGWEKALTDADGAYAELMAGSYSANQPDFTWLEPYEAKDFTQCWYPIGSIGAPLCATLDAAVSLGADGLHVQATRPLQGAMLKVDGQAHALDLQPGAPQTVPAAADASSIELYDAAGCPLLCYTREPASPHPMPAPLPDNPPPESLPTAQACYLAGVHVAQYRDPIAQPGAYFREALLREPDFAPALVALSREAFARARFKEALSYGMRAWKALTAYNFHPESGEAAYLIGLACEALGREQEALDWYHRAAYQQDACGRAMTGIARVEGRLGHNRAMLEAAEAALAQHANNETAWTLAALALLRLGERSAAWARLDALLLRDPLCQLARLLRHDNVEWLASLRTDAPQLCLDLAEELVACGEAERARALLRALPVPTRMTAYVLGALGDERALRSAPGLPVGIAFPSRALEIAALERAIRISPEDATAQNLLACARYHYGDADEAIALFEHAMHNDPEDYMACRNLAVALYTHRQDAAGSLSLLKTARGLKPHDQQLIWESAYLMGRAHIPPEEIAAFLEGEPYAREDIRIEHARSLNRCGRYGEALRLMTGHAFIPCEGGEHAVAEQYMLARHGLGLMCYAAGDVSGALGHFKAAQELPDSLGAGLWHEALLAPHRYREARCLERLGDAGGAVRLYQWILSLGQDYFTDMHLPELPCWQAMAWRRLGKPAPGQALIAAHLRRYEQARNIRDAGYYRATPFFICYLEPAATQRAAACDWQLAMAHFAAGDIAGARALAGRSLSGEPFTLYAHLLLREGGDMA